jgi:hypothetical protein
MTPLESWGKEMGWCQTGKLNFWRNGSYNEFMGVSDSYFCLLMDWRGRILLRVHFFSENKERAKEIKLLLKRHRDSLPKCGMALRDNAVTLTFGSFLFFFQNKLERAKAALPAVISLLRNNGVRTSATCACGRQEGLKCVLQSDGAVHIQCAECIAKVGARTSTTKAGMQPKK